MTRKGLVRKVDDAFSRFIRARDGKCVTCGSTEGLDCSHIIRKARGHFLRWRPENAAAQCRRCHMEHHNVSEMALLRYATKWLGEEKLEAMRLEAHTETHFKDYQLVEMARYFDQKADEVERGGVA
jgi:5-methylcytosine-specific restriction endonuclease McrA